MALIKVNNGSFVLWNCTKIKVTTLYLHSLNCLHDTEGINDSKWTSWIVLNIPPLMLYLVCFQCCAVFWSECLIIPWHWSHRCVFLEKSAGVIEDIQEHTMFSNHSHDIIKASVCLIHTQTQLRTNVLKRIDHVCVNFT